MKKIIALILLISAIGSAIGIAASAADLGSGATVVANDVKIVKSGLLGRKISFCDADFKQGLCISDFKEVTITKLPESSHGTLMMAGRRVSEGTTIKRKNLPSLVFIPASREVSEASFKFTISEYASGEELDFIIRFTERINYEPKIDEENEASLVIKTQREIGAHGKMRASDGEGDKLEYMVISYPRHGMLTNIDKETGEYVYTPTDSYVGDDSFVYVARDEWGNFSRTATVSIRVDERMSEVKYVDMQNRPEYCAAVTMTAMGIMSGKVVGDGVYFNPDDTVTRAEFVAMTLKALGIKADSTLTSTYFDDNESIPTPLLGYVATAQRMGIINGRFVNGELLFSPNEQISKYEAAGIMAALTNAKTEDTDVSINNSSLIPCWAREDVYLMCSVGIFDTGTTEFDATSPVTRADCAGYLYKMISRQ